MMFAKAKSLLRNAVKPIYFFDDDPDGLCAFLILYHMSPGRGIIIKSKPTVGAQFLRKVPESQGDLAVILDKPGIDEKFIEKCQVPIVWIDHHEEQDTDVTYINPHQLGLDPYPTSHWAYQISQDENYLWLAEAGCISDWQVTDIHERAKKKYPDLIPDSDNPPEILFDSKFGKLCKILMFNLKGRSSEVKKSKKVLSRIKTPYEILDKTTTKGKFIHRRYERLANQYDEILQEAMQKKSDELLVYQYEPDRTSFTAYLSNELLYRFPKKVILVCRRKGGEYKCSLRSSGDIKIRDILEQIIPQVDGYGGGHDYACGACIKEHDFQRFKSLIKEQLNL